MFPLHSIPSDIGNAGPCASARKPSPADIRASSIPEEFSLKPGRSEICPHRRHEIG